MSAVDKLYRWLSQDPNLEADRVLLAALEQAEPEYVPRIVAALLSRQTEAGWAGLIANYDRLDDEARSQLQGRPELLRAGIGLALRGPAAQTRCHALALLTEQPMPSLATLVADALRDPSAAVRESAAQALRAAVDGWLSLVEDEGQTARFAAQLAADRAALVRGLSEALRTFESHRRPDVLESCLWMARELGEPLWKALSATRSLVAHMVREHLKSLNHPRLAGFLILALARREWRTLAATLLNSWSTRRHLLAIARNSDLLRDPLIRQSVRCLKRPLWLAAGGPSLASLPPHLRAAIPQWVCHLGLTEEDRLRWLALWLNSPMAEVHRAAVYALASLNNPETTGLLAKVADRPGPMQQFAKWYSAGRRRMLGSGRVGLENAARPASSRTGPTAELSA